MSKAVPLTSIIAIVDQNGAPTPWFTQLWQNSFSQVLAAQGSGTAASVAFAASQIMPPVTMANTANNFGVGPTL